VYQISRVKDGRGKPSVIWASVYGRTCSNSLTGWRATEDGHAQRRVKIEGVLLFAGLDLLLL